MTTTPNYGWAIPTPNGDADTWGNELNANLLAQDTTVKAISDVANGALAKASNLSDLASASTARTNLGLGTASTQSTSAFDAAGAASSAVSALPNGSRTTLHYQNGGTPSGGANGDVWFIY